jgi:transposase
MKAKQQQNQGVLNSRGQGYTAVGIDISKAYFDAQLGQRVVRFANTRGGRGEFRRRLPADAHCVIESTGNYADSLAEYLVGEGIKTSVVNPVMVKRFGQMTLRRAKTDRADAKLITLFTESSPVELRDYNVPSDAENESKQLQSVRDTLVRQKTALKNHLEALCMLPRPSTNALRGLEKSLAESEAAIKELDEQIASAAKAMNAAQYAALMTIPGIGPCVAAALMSATRAFGRFDTAKQLVAFLGLSPRIIESGSSVPRGRASISKTGSPHLHALLFMAARSAARFNPACKALFECLVAKGKAKTLAYVAVANKLLHQAFAIAKSNQKFDADFAQKKQQQRQISLAI